MPNIYLTGAKAPLIPMFEEDWNEWKQRVEDTIGNTTEEIKKKKRELQRLKTALRSLPYSV